MGKHSHCRLQNLETFSCGIERVATAVLGYQYSWRQNMKSNPSVSHVLANFVQQNTLHHYSANNMLFLIGQICSLYKGISNIYFDWMIAAFYLGTKSSGRRNKKLRFGRSEVIVELNLFYRDLSFRFRLNLTSPYGKNVF